MTNNDGDIKSASGVELGCEFEGNSPRLSETERGEKVYGVLMDKPFLGMMDCHVCVTPLSSRVSEIALYRDVAEDEAGPALFGGLKKYLSRYGSVEIETPETSDGFLDLRCLMGKREISVESKKVIGRRVRISLRYIDHEVKDLAEEEREALMGVF
jgi:hypothetical protein